MSVEKKSESARSSCWFSSKLYAPGIGTWLLRHLQAEAQASSRPLRIHVERFNPALRLYERLGFRDIEDKGVYLFMEWRPAAA